MSPEFLQLEKAAAHFLLSSHFMPSYDRAYALYGRAMTERGCLRVAFTSLREALRLNPNNNFAKIHLDNVHKALGARPPNPNPAQLLLDSYPSAAPRMLAQVRPGPDGRPVIDGIRAEFCENGRLKRFADFVR